MTCSLGTWQQSSREISCPAFAAGSSHPEVLLLTPASTSPAHSAPTPEESRRFSPAWFPYSDVWMCIKQQFIWFYPYKNCDTEDIAALLMLQTNMVSIFPIIFFYSPAVWDLPLGWESFFLRVVQLSQSRVSKCYNE